MNLGFSLVELGALGELLGSLGVIVSLLYVSTQIRQNTRSMQASSYQTVVDAVNQVNRLLVQEEGLPGLVLRGQQNLAALEPEERIRFGAFLAHVIYNHEIALHLHKQGFLDQDSFDAHCASVVQVLKAPGAALWWRSARTRMSETLKQHLDGALSGAP